MILDKLVEKKDLVIYIDQRIEHLRTQKRRAILLEPKNRAKAIRQLKGRIFELQYLKKHINDIKDTGKRFWRINNET